MADLKTTYKDDVLNTSVNEKRKYNMIQNADGTVSFDDVTTYTQNGDSFGAKDVNDTNTAVNTLNENLTGFACLYNPEDDFIYIGGEKWKSAGFKNPYYLPGIPSASFGIMTGKLAELFSINGVSSTANYVMTNTGVKYSGSYFQFDFADLCYLDYVILKSNSPNSTSTFRIDYSIDGSSFIEGDTNTLPSSVTNELKIYVKKDCKAFRITFVSGAAYMHVADKYAYEFKQITPFGR